MRNTARCFTKHQLQLLKVFASRSDELFELDVIRTDSFTGEIGEYVACHHFKLQRTTRSYDAVDAVCKQGLRYQIKTEVWGEKGVRSQYVFKDSRKFDFLVVVYFDREYQPLKMLLIHSSDISVNRLTIRSATQLPNTLEITKTEIKLPVQIRRALSNFAAAYEDLVLSEAITSRRIVGDIGEKYACHVLGLKQCDNPNQKGYDAIHNELPITFEIKTRRVYESARRTSETRRVNGLKTKTADYLIVVTLDREFLCSGMWMIPLKNVVNITSPNLRNIVTAEGCKTLIDSSVDWLPNQAQFQGFPLSDSELSKPKFKKQTVKRKPRVQRAILTGNVSNLHDEGNDSLQLPQPEAKPLTFTMKEYIGLAIIIIAIIFALAYLALLNQST